jgi:hypothetical protein
MRGLFLRPLSKARRIPLPVFSVEGTYRHGAQRRGVQTTHVHAVAVGIGPGNIKRFDAAHLAKQMRGDTRIEFIRLKVLRTFEQLESGSRNDQMKKADLPADRTVAVDRFDFRRCNHSKFHAPAMTAPRMLDQASRFVFLHRFYRRCTYGSNRTWPSSGGILARDSSS